MGEKLASGAKKKFVTTTMLKVHLYGPLTFMDPFTCMEPFRFSVALLHL